MTFPSCEFDAVLVVVPVRNEEELLPRALAALATAIASVNAAPRPPSVAVVLVLDRCTDASARVAAHWPAFDVIESTAGAVGSARRDGARHLLRSVQSPRNIWIATTDGDCAVPWNWLVTQLVLARNGAELVLGTVLPDSQLDDRGQALWAASNTNAEGHGHVHGANLGVRADRYREAGEFAPVDSDEDQLLVTALRRVGVVEARTARIPVLTSGRTTGRAPAGFAGYLREQAAHGI